MSILGAIDRAYRTMEERKWDTIYWAIDLHGVCLKSNYEQGGYQWINDRCVEALKMISKLEETCIILWSSVYEHEQGKIIAFFNQEGITVHGFNENPFEPSNALSDFDEKFYFSVLLDDKAGFDPASDWRAIVDYFVRKEAMEGQVKPVVQYIREGNEYIELGDRAYVYAVDHPRLGACEVGTSRVIRIEPNTGVFETLNTIYKPVEQLNG